MPSSKAAEARAVKAQIDALDMKVEIAAEKYNEASIEHARISGDLKKVNSKLASIKARTLKVQLHLNTRANNMYRSGKMGFVDVLLGARSFEEFSTIWDLLKQFNDTDADAIAELKDLKAEADVVQADLAEKEKAAAAQKAVMKKNKTSIEKQLAERKRKLAGLESEIQALQDEEERAAASRASSWKSKSGGGKKFPPPTRAARSEVVSVAKKYLGAPYKWGASGPNRFDCSGFTMFVYRQVGVSLPHSSRAQIGYGERVSKSDLQPGDLVFFGSPIHHVGIYVGGGMYIHAPHSGDVVRISSMDRSGYAGASRP